MGIHRGANRVAVEDNANAQVASPSSSPLPSSIRANHVAGAIEPEAAIAVWDAVMTAEGPSFFEGYRGDQDLTGPFDDEEKVRMVREAFEVQTANPGGDPTRASRAQVVRETALRLGLIPRLAATRGVSHRNIPPGPIGTMMLLGMEIVAMLEDGRTTEQALDAQPALFLHGRQSPLRGAPAADRAFIRSALVWARSGFPRVVLASHRLAAAMMWIDATRGIESARPPWEAFWISIPNNLVRYHGERGSVDITEGIVHVRPSGAVVGRFGDSTSLGLQVLRPNLAALGNTEGVGRGWAKHHADSAALSDLVDCVEHAGDTVAAATEMLANLVLSVCLDLTAHRPAPRAQRGAAASKVSTRDAATTTDYVIERRAVYVDDPTAEEVNCIAVVRDYVRDPTRARSATTQRIHRAHYQMQVHGPRGSLRRLQLHRAYRQGPEDAPFAVRPHVRRGRS